MTTKTHCDLFLQSLTGMLTAERIARTALLTTARCGALVTRTSHVDHPNVTAVLEPLPVGHVCPRTWAEGRAPHRSNAV